MTLVSFWFVVLAVLWTGFLVLDGFDFGVGMLHGFLGRDEVGRSVAIRTIGPLWDGNEVWLIVAVAGTFAAFPIWYATLFSGFYPLFLAVLVALVLRGVAFEFRGHASSPRVRHLWEAALTIGSLITPLGIGVTLGNLPHGVPIDAQQEFVGGLGDLLQPYPLATGLAITLLCLQHGAMYLALRTSGDVQERAARTARLFAPFTLVVVVGFAVWTRFVSGHLLLSVPGFLAVLAGIATLVLARKGRSGAAFVATSVTLAAVVASVFADLYPRVMVSTMGAVNDLTVWNSAASSTSLMVMTVVLVVVLPVVLLYQGWAYRVFRFRVGRADVGAVEGPE